MAVTHDSESARSRRPAGSRPRRPCLPTAARWPSSRSGGRTSPSTGRRTSTSRGASSSSSWCSRAWRSRSASSGSCSRAPSAGSRRRSGRRADRPRGRAVRSAAPRRSPTPKAARRACSCGPARPRSSPTTRVHAPAVPGGARGRSTAGCTALATTAGSTSQTGRPLAGPPQRPLPRILLEVRDGIVYATGVEERRHDPASPCPRAADDDRQRHPRLRGADRRPAALAADGDDERLSRRRHRHGGSGGARQPRLPRSQCRAALVPVPPGVSERPADRHGSAPSRRSRRTSLPRLLRAGHGDGDRLDRRASAGDAAHRLGAARDQSRRLRGVDGHARGPAPGVFPARASTT